MILFVPCYKWILSCKLNDLSYYFQLVDGKAEIFGTELAPNKCYTFLPGANVAVFTWHGCRLKLTGKTGGTYIATETPMVSRDFKGLGMNIGVWMLCSLSCKICLYSFTVFKGILKLFSELIKIYALVEKDISFGVALCMVSDISYITGLSKLQRNLFAKKNM